MFLKNPDISILKLKSSVVDLSVVAVTCAVLGTWDYWAAIGIIAGILIHYFACTNPNPYILSLPASPNSTTL